MKLTQKKVKEFIACMKRERKELYCDFFNARKTLDDKSVKIIARYNWLGGQLYAYEKILQIMQFKVK